MWSKPDAFESGYAVELSRRLTSLPEKAEAYALEPGYRDALSWCTSDGIDSVLHTGLLLVRPDGLRFERVPAILGHYRRLGLFPFAWTSVELTAGQVHEIWRYQLNAASGPRVRRLQVVCTAGPSLLAFLRAGPGTRHPVPVSVLMAEAKGSADPARHRGWELRARLACVNRTLTYVHVADEPADVLRDGQLLLGATGLRDALNDPGADRTDEVLAAAARLVHLQADLVETDERDAAWGLCERTGAVDRWELLAAAGDLPAATAETPNLIDSSGSRPWWASAGHQDRGARYLAERLAE